MQTLKAGFYEYFWFGIPLFDARYPIPPEYVNAD
jgi:hypothetical protein